MEVVHEMICFARYEALQIRKNAINWTNVDGCILKPRTQMDYHDKWLEARPMGQFVDTQYFPQSRTKNEFLVRCLDSFELADN